MARAGLEAARRERLHGGNLSFTEPSRPGQARRQMFTTIVEAERLPVASIARTK